jgi:sulfoxide reductase catalytic subunit YedY
MTPTYKPIPILPSEITPRSLYLSRRDFLKTAGIATGAAFLAACAPLATTTPTGPAPQADGRTDELGDPVNTFDDITHYNNFYEFTTDKQGVSVLAEKFTTHPWTVEVGGLVRHPQKFAIEDLIKKFPQEERIYRLRCVEAWSMVIPWNGFPLSRLLNEVQPLSDAKYVRFETVMRPEEMPGQKSIFYGWPYTEGLRIDEAMHDLTLLATGLYGEALPAADGAPVRLVVPWKYGFKSIKSIVRIDLVDEQPATFWNNISPNEYGFYSNVNPERSHPRWSQASERRIGELNRRPTLMLNGYADQVAHLYEGMDLNQNY